MGQTLENGVYLPSEGERNCYAGLKTNWEILDQKVADVTALQQAVAGALHRQIVASLPTTDIDPNTIYMILSGTSATENVYNEFMYVNNAWELIGTSATDLTNYYTKSEVDGKLLLKANASDLTSHTGDTTIHVTASDKTKWTNSANAVVFRYSSTALTASSTNSNALLDNTDNLKVGDKVIDSSVIDLANDSDVVHKSGDETVNGIKNFKDLIPIDGDYLGNEASTNQRTNICLRSNRDTADKSGAFITRFRQNRTQGGLQQLDLQKIGFDVVENGVRTNNVFDIQCTDWLNDVPQRVNFISSATSYSWGESSKKSLINGLNPSSLGMPDLSNGIDISSYLTNIGTATPSEYTPSVNGWIVLKISAPSGSVVIRVSSDNGIDSYSYSERSDVGGLTADGDYTYEKFVSCVVPCVKNDKLNIYIKPSTASIVSAKFYPCQGNV